MSAFGYHPGGRLGVVALIGVLGFGTVTHAQEVAPRAAPPAAPAAAPPYAPPLSQYSPTLGIQYKLVPYYGAYAARLTQHPVPGSPLGQPQIQLEPGDLITHLDNIPIHHAGELERHYGQTSVTFVNVRTNALETRWATLPPLGGDGPIPPPPPPAPPMSLGILAVPVTVYSSAYAGGPAYPSRALRVTSVTPLSPAGSAGIQPGDMILTAGGYAMTDINALRYAIRVSDGSLTMTVRDPYGNTRQATAYMANIGAPAAAAAPAP